MIRRLTRRNRGAQRPTVFGACNPVLRDQIPVWRFAYVRVRSPVAATRLAWPTRDRYFPCHGMQNGRCVLTARVYAKALSRTVKYCNIRGGLQRCAPTRPSSRTRYEIAKPAIYDAIPNGNANTADNAIRLSNFARAASLAPRARCA
jgi:hypothetical protein